MNDSGRIREYDFLRVLAVFLMIQGHSIWALAEPQLIDPNNMLWSIWLYLRGLTAPLFLFVSGAVHVHANKRQADGRLERGVFSRRIIYALLLIALGYLLHLPKGIWSWDFSAGYEWIVFGNVDILQLYGVSLIIVTLLFYFIRSSKILMYSSLIIAALIVLLSSFITEFAAQTSLPHAVKAYFSFDMASRFPIIPYLSFMLAGVGFGIYFREIRSGRAKLSENRFLIWFVLSMLVLYRVSDLLTDMLGMSAMYDKANINVLFEMFFWLAVIISSVMLWFKKISVVHKHIYVFALNALPLYIIHLIILYGIGPLGGAEYYFGHSLSLLGSIVGAVIIELLSFFIIYFISKAFKNQRIIKLKKR